MRRPTRIATLVLAAAAALCLSACTGEDQQGSAAQRMDAWVRGTGLGESTGTLVADNARIAQVAPRGSGALHGACATIVIDASAANSDLPAPDPTVTQLLSQAYGLEGTVGNECFDAAGNPALLTKSVRGGIRADALLDEALQRIRAIDGKVPVTTTTTGNTGNSGVGGIFG